MPLRRWYNCGTSHFHQADFYLAEMNMPTMLSNQRSTAWSCAENRVFVGFSRIQSSEQDLKYLYWTISKIFLWHLFTWKGTYMIDWVGRYIEYMRMYVIYMTHTNDVWLSCVHCKRETRSHIGVYHIRKSVYHIQDTHKWCLTQSRLRVTLVYIIYIRVYIIYKIHTNDTLHKSIYHITYTKVYVISECTSYTWYTQITS